MSARRGTSFIMLVLFLAVLCIALPVSAYSVALYGTSSGFSPDLHTDSVVVVKSVPGASGSDLDASVDLFTQPSVDVIILGGAATFSPATAAKIETAVAGGKILVVTYPCNELFSASLPASNGGTAKGGQYLEVSDPNATMSKAVFSQPDTRFALNGTAPDKEQVTANAGTITVLNYDTGLPALLYGKYGRGYVIEWTVIPSPSYMDAATADSILHHMILGLLPAPTPTQTATQTATLTATATSPTTAVTTGTTIATTRPVTTTAGTVQATGSSVETGDIEVYSSPAGASILIDDVYYGSTPGKVNGVPAGSHVLLLTLSGYQDNTQTITVGPGVTNRAYGTLQPLILSTAAPAETPTPVQTVIVPVIVTVTATPEPTQTTTGLLGNSSILVALIGVVTALIAAGATVFTHIRPPKK